MRNLSDILNQPSERYYYYNGMRMYLENDSEHLLFTFKDIKEPKQQITILESIDNTRSIYSDIEVENLTNSRYLLVKLDRTSVFELASSIEFNQPEIETIGQVFIGESNVKMGLTNQIFIEIKKRYKSVDLSKLYDEYGVIDSKPFGENTFLLTLDLNAYLDAMDVANAFFETGYFEFAEPNFFRSIKTSASIPNDPLFSSEWHIPRINADKAWCWTTGQNVSIGIMDVGINTSHPDLQANFVGTYDPTGRPLGADAHGTPCAGCALAVGDNGIGVAGIAYSANLYQIRIGYNPTNDPNNLTFVSTDAWIAGGLDYAMQNNIDIISASVSIGNPGSIIDSKINTYTNNGRNGLGGVMLASTGNEGSPSIMGYPAKHPNVFAVGASDFNDERASFSNFGGLVEFLAPGVFIPTTSYTGGYTDFSGTSAACPVAAGAAALILSEVPNLTRTQLRDAIGFSCDKVGSSGYYPSSEPEGRNGEYGFGRINVNNYFNSYYGIQGVHLFCGSEAQYNVENLPPGITTTWTSSNPNMPISTNGLVTNPSGQAGRSILTADLSNPCVDSREKIVVVGSYAEEVWAYSENAFQTLTRYWADGNNPDRKIGIPNDNPASWQAAIYFGYAPSVGKSTLNPPNVDRMWSDKQGWNITNNGVSSVEIVSTPPTWQASVLNRFIMIGVTGDASGVLEVILGLPCGPINVKFYIEGLELF